MPIYLGLLPSAVFCRDVYVSVYKLCTYLVKFTPFIFFDAIENGIFFISLSDR